MASLLYALRPWIVLLLMIHTSLAKPLCHPDESSALMEFKRSFRIDTDQIRCVYPKVESWPQDGHGDCCSWDGVECNEANGHVTGLDLSSSCLFGIITSNTSLFRLLHLESLNLALNDFNSSSIPYGFGGLSRLRYLNLSISEFSGKVPADISRLSRLISLDLSSEWASLEMPNVENFVQNLTMLRELDLSSITMASPFPHVLANLSSLKSLKLSKCGLHGVLPVSIFQLPRLEVLDISYNGKLSGFIPEQQWGNPLKSLSLGGTILSGSLPSSLSNLSQLAYLDLQRSKFMGQIPASLANLTQLSYLDLSVNNFTGDISHWLGNLARLNYLDLSDNQLSGQLPSSFENLTQLVRLNLSFNNWQCEIPNSLWELKGLGYLDLGRNNFSGTVDLHKLKNLESLLLDFNNISFVSKPEINATLPKLSTVSLVSCNLREFPRFLGYLKGLEWVDLSNNKIGGSVPSWMWNGSRETLMDMGLSHNYLTDFENGHINLPMLTYMDLSHNLLTSFVNNQINQSLPMLTYLDISSNSLKTALPSPPPLAVYYNISNNFLFGEIQSICRARSLVILDLSINRLNGGIPSCLGNMVSLSILNLGENKLEGMIHHDYPKGCALKIIDLTNNRLQGPIPRSLANCSMLEYLNLGYNQMHDRFPSWLSKLTKLKAIILKSNKFHGPVETHQNQFNFSNLHILDLSNNGFNGVLPSKLLQSFHAMKVIVSQDQLEYIHTSQRLPQSLDTAIAIVAYDMKLMNKGTEREYSKVPYALMGIDLSNNKFEGCIPDLVGDLKSLISLNLSNNILTGSIPPSIANLTVLESLDLSRNKLSGEIPQQLAQLTFLSSFDVSHNQLSGPIPRGSQFNTFGTSSFAMNEGLCGSPLPKKCTAVGDNIPLPPSPLKEENDNDSIFDLDWKVVLIGAGAGFFIGVVLGNLIIDEKSRWFLYYSKMMAKRWKTPRRHRIIRSRARN
ncbi:receptor-like protein 6 [Rhodamnia argentea]|uniref:Receptor-like protein 6 n=1 Tax=Rhodamnia argentea TaxID=178133 RepID=A0A8B8MWH0_9MYRT|nr:receptor-like protein 6 [Rhodamnia argentea]